MEFNVNHACKIVEVWLNQEEKQNADLQKKLKPLYQRFKAQKYLVAVFISGEQNMEEATSNLLCYNRKRIAQLEVEKARRHQEAVNS